MASAILLKTGWSVRVFEGSDQNGTSKCFTSSDKNLTDDTFEDGTPIDDRISSLILYHRPDCPPSAPQNVTASDREFNDKIRIIWDAVPGATSYEVWRHVTDDSASAELLDASVSDTYYNDTSALPLVMKPYMYWIRAKNSSGVSAFSNVETGARRGDPPPVPLHIDATDGDHPDKVQITWSDIPEATSYVIYRSDTPDSARQLVGNSNSTTFQDFHITEDTPYWYWVVAKNSHGSSGFSDPDSGYRSGNLLPTIPTLKDAMVLANYLVVFDWSGDGAFYELELWGGGLGTTRKYDHIDATRWIEVGLPVSSEPYYWQVTAHNNYGRSKPSNSGSFRISQLSSDPVYLDFSTSIRRQMDIDLAVTNVGQHQTVFTQTVTTDQNGNIYDVLLSNINPGFYDIYVKPAGHLRRRIANVELLSGTNSLNFGQMQPGDANDDNFVNLNDLIVILNSWGQSQSNADLDGDGVVGVGDIILTLSNWGSSGDGWEDKGPSSAVAASLNTNITALNATGSITLSPNAGTFNVGDTVDVQVILDTGSHDTTGVDARIFYDPGVLEVQDADPNKNKIQVSPGTLYSSYNLHDADPEHGEILIGATDSTFQGQGILATITFKVIASINNTEIKVYYQNGRTTDSNVWDSQNLDVLGSAGVASFQIVGSSSRPMPIVSLSPPSGTRLNSTPLKISAETFDQNNQVKEVKFSAKIDGVWTPLGTDPYGADGWSLTWDNSTVRDGDVEISATALLLGGEGTITSSNVLLDRVIPEYITSDLNPGSTVTQGELVKIDVTASDDRSEVDYIEAYVKSVNAPQDVPPNFIGKIAGSAGTIFWSTAEYAPEQYQVTFSIQDKAGNWGPDSQPQLFVDIAPNQGNGVFLPLILNKATPCDENLSKVKIWEGELSWHCDTTEKQEGQSSARLEAAILSDSELYSPLIPAQPNRTYEVSYWVKTNLQVDDAQVFGKVIAAQYTSQASESDEVNENRIDTGFSLGENVGGVTDWVKKSYTFTTDVNANYVRLRAPLGLQGRAKGQVWFDEVRIVEK